MTTITNETRRVFEYGPEDGHFFYAYNFHQGKTPRVTISTPGGGFGVWNFPDQIVDKYEASVLLRLLVFSAVRRIGTRCVCALDPSIDVSRFSPRGAESCVARGFASLDSKTATYSLTAEGRALFEPVTVEKEMVTVRVPRDKLDDVIRFFPEAERVLD